MQSRRLLVVLVPCLLFLLPTCAYRVHTIGSRSPQAPEPLDRAAGVCVVKDPEAAAYELDEVLTGRIERLLERKGYTLATSSEATYYLFFDYRIRSLMARMRLDFISGAATGIETVRREGPYVHTLALRVVQADAFRDRQEEEVIWSGGAVMSEVPTHGQRFHDMVLVAAFEQFDRETAETTTLRIRRNDSRVRRLSR